MGLGFFKDLHVFSDGPLIKINGTNCGNNQGQSKIKHGVFIHGVSFQKPAALVSNAEWLGFLFGDVVHVSISRSGE